MSSLSNLKSSDLEPLFPSESDPSISPLQVLILNNTGIGDDAAPYVGSCEELETLGVASTRFTSGLRFNPPQPVSVLTLASQRMGSFLLLSSCKKLQNLDVTSCRQIPIVDRRRIFEGGRYTVTSLSMLTSPIGVGGIPRMMEHLSEFGTLRLVDEMRRSFKGGLH
jgi:hypothetical protein